MSITIIRRELPPWLKRKSHRPTAWEMPLDWAYGDNMPRSIELDSPVGKALLRGAPRGGSTAAAFVAMNASFATGTAIHTNLTVLSPSQHGLAMTEFGISFDGVTASAIPGLVEIGTSTQAGAGTPGTTPTAVQVRGRSGGTAPTASANYTAEPTAQTALRQWLVSPNGGLFVYPLPLGREMECDASGGTAKALFCRVTTAATVNSRCYIEVEAIG